MTTETRTTHTPDPNHPAPRKAKKKVASGDFSKAISERDGLWYGVWWQDEDEHVLGSFPSELAANRAAEDAIARAMYSAEVEAADEEIREEQRQAEEDRIKSENDRQEAARSVGEHKFVDPRPQNRPEKVERGQTK